MKLTKIVTKEMQYWRIKKHQHQPTAGHTPHCKLCGLQKHARCHK